MATYRHKTRAFNRGRHTALSQYLRSLDGRRLEGNARDRDAEELDRAVDLTEISAVPHVIGTTR